MQRDAIIARARAAAAAGAAARLDQEVPACEAALPTRDDGYLCETDNAMLRRRRKCAAWIAADALTRRSVV